MISIDLGKEISMALWSDKKCQGIVNYSFSPKLFIWENLRDFIYTLDRLIDKYRPIVVERPSRDLYIQWAEFTDIRELALRKKLDIYSYVTSQIKKYVVGKGRASKDEVKEAVISSGFLSSSVHAVTEHDYDSISVGICHIKMTQKVVAILRSESW